MKRIKLNNKIGFMIYKVYGQVPKLLVDNICEFVHNNYRRKPYGVKKYTCNKCGNKINAGKICKC